MVFLPPTSQGPARLEGPRVKALGLQLTTGTSLARFMGLGFTGFRRSLSDEPSEVIVAEFFGGETRLRSNRRGLGRIYRGLEIGE